jgi:hypothetical protein
MIPRSQRPENVTGINASTARDRRAAFGVAN